MIPAVESLTVEFKISFNEDVVETLVAFSNAKGGTVYIGVADKGEVKGIQIGKETVQNWINEVKNKTAPQIIPDAEIFTLPSPQGEGLGLRLIVALFAMEYPIKPVSTRGRYYKRIGNSNHLLSVSEVSNMHLQTVNSSWDHYPRPGKSMKDISSVKVQKVMDTIMHRNANFVIDTAQEFLVKNELLLDDDKISNGCYLMFCKDDNLYSTIQMGHFSSEIIIKDDQSDSGDIIGQIEDSCPLYASISIYVSTPRNRQIAKMVKDMGLIEKYGSGIRRIFSSFEQEKLPEPQFCNISDGFMVTVFCERIDIIWVISWVINKY